MDIGVPLWVSYHTSDWGHNEVWEPTKRPFCMCDSVHEATRDEMFLGSATGLTKVRYCRDLYCIYVPMYVYIFLANRFSSGKGNKMRLSVLFVFAWVIVCFSLCSSMWTSMHTQHTCIVCISVCVVVHAYWYYILCFAPGCTWGHGVTTALPPLGCLIQQPLKIANNIQIKCPKK